MARKHAHPEHANHERWLVSYADFITLLFAFFTVLYATAQSDMKKIRQFVGSMDRAMSSGIFSDGGGSSVSINKYSSPDPKGQMDLGISIKDIKQEAEAALDTPGLSGLDVLLENRPNGMAVVLEGFSFFNSGQTEISPMGQAFLSRLALILSASPHFLRVEGHTDNRPTPEASSNWDLSLARALSVTRFLMAHQIDPARLSAYGMGAYVPLVPNESDEARRRNRRVEIVVLEKSPAAQAHWNQVSVNRPESVKGASGE